MLLLLVLFFAFLVMSSLVSIVIFIQEYFDNKTNRYDD